VPVTVITADEITGNMQGKLGARILRLQATGSGIVHADVTNPGTPTLTLSGPVDKLAAAAEALGNPAIDLASMPSVTELEQTGNTLSAYTLTFADLGAAKPKLQGVGRIEYVIGVSQSRYPGPVSGFQIHIQGAYTPVPKTGQVTMSVLWNDQIIDSQLLNEQDIYLVDVKVDQTQVQRDNAITLRMDATPAGGACSRKGQPYQLDINGKASTLAANPGQGLAPGFARFPQTLGGYLPVAFGSGQTAATLLKDAAEIVSSLQRVSASSLHVETVSFEEFAKASYPGLVVGATPADADALKAPLRFYPWRAVDANGTRFTVTVDGPFAAFEAYNLDGRDLLMLGATGPTDKSQELMAKLAKAGNTDPDGWFSLNADLLVAVPGEKPFMIDSGTIPPQAKAVDEFRMLPWWLWALVAVLLIGLIIRLYTLRRRRQRIKREINEARLAAERSFGAAWQGPPQGSS
jgi:hypothetical protein